MTSIITEPPVPTLPRKRWTIEEFERLARADFLREGGRIDLWDGDIITDRSTELVRKRWTIEEFDRLMLAGFIREGSRTFLWDGEIIAPMPEYAPHVNACENLADALKARLVRDAWTVNGGRPIALAEGFLPQPDIVVARGPRSGYRNGPPTAADAALVVEVASTSYHFDAGEYLRHYAVRGIPLYWIIHLKFRRVEVFSGPIPGESRFEHRTDYGLGDTIPLVLSQGGSTFGYEGIAVEAILRDSMED